MFLKKFKLIADASLEVISAIDIEMTDGIVFYFSIFSQVFCRLFGNAWWCNAVMLTNLKQYREMHVPSMLDWPVLVYPYRDARTNLVDETLRHQHFITIIGIR